MSEQRHLAGNEGCSPRLEAFSTCPAGPLCLAQNRQYNNQDPRESRGGHLFHALDARGRETSGLGRASLTADHISGQSNIWANWLSREQLDLAEWRLHPDIFREITLWYGRPLVDFFATPQNTQFPRFFSRYRSPGAEGCNALRCPWPPSLLYAFSPLPLILLVIWKLLDERTELLLGAPRWPRRSWYADLVGLSVSPPWTLPQHKTTLSQGVIAHLDPQWLKLTIWRLRESC